MTGAADASSGASSRGRGPLRGLLWLGLAALGALHLFGARRDAWFAGDEAWYVGLARALSSGEGYRFDGLPHGVYPPGYPIALMPAVDRWGVDPHALVVYSGVLSLLGVLAVAWWLARRGDVRSPGLWIWFLLASVGVFEVFTDLRSEGLFLLVLALLLGTLERHASPRPDGPRPGRLALAGGAVLGLLLGAALPAVRSVGMALPVALLLSAATGSLGPGRRLGAGWLARAGGAFVGSVAYLLWWIPRGGRYGDERSYLNLLTMVDPHEPDLGRAGPLQVLERLFDQTAIQLSHGVELLTNIVPFHPFLFGWPQLVLAALVALGIARELARRNPVAGWFFLGYMAIIVSWPFDEGTRFLVPVFPMLLLFVVRGGEWAWSVRPRTAEGWRHAARWMALLAVVASVETLARGATSKQGWLWVALWAASAGLAGFRGGALAEWSPPVRRRRVRAGWALVFLLVGLPSIVAATVMQRGGETKFQADRIGGGVEWIRAHTDSSTVLASTAEHQGLHLHTGRTVRGVPTTSDPERLWAAVDTTGARYLVVPGDHEYPYLRPTGDARFSVLDATRPGVLHLVFAWPLGRVFELRAP